MSTLRSAPQPTTQSVWYRYAPLFLSVGLIIADQITKAIIVRNIEPYRQSGFFIEVIGDFLRIIHTTNLGAAFSLGSRLPDVPRRLLFSILPLGILVGLVIYLLRGKDMATIQRWALASIIGGGLGNLIDRLFRADGVIDFIDIKFYGLFGMERWPTFNVADSSVVVGGILFVAAMLFIRSPDREQPDTDGSTDTDPHKEQEQPQ